MDISIRQGETLSLNIEVDDITADTLRLLVSDSEDNVVIDETANFDVVDGKAIAEVISNDTDLDIGAYSYMLIVTYEDGTVEKLPDPEDCPSADCTLPTLTICKAIPTPGVS